MSRPEEKQVIHFKSIRILARRIKLEKRLVRLTAAHRGQTATADEGYVIVRKRWYPT